MALIGLLVYYLFLFAFLAAYVVAMVFICKKVLEPKDGSISMLAHVLLLFFGGTIWSCVWNYRTTSVLNNVPGEEYRDPVTKLLLCFFVPFYEIYWVYKSAQRIDKKASMVGISSDLTTICLILSILMPVIAYIIMQDKINEICKVTPLKH